MGCTTTDRFGQDRKVVWTGGRRRYGPRARTPIDSVDHCRGAEPFAPGGPHPAVTAYATVSYGKALTEPHGRVHWAGSETAGEWAGTLNGAVLTGRRAAERVIA
ncbi:FAD-dependent oxidoreductase [Streptomyces sp. NPDC021100]|uniref:FAD-dependent oxidoreductase n=1 Tax=Streptomyces sp. NPDC021100 TaxID=3365114 RepID=UPI0037BCD6EF